MVTTIEKYKYIYKNIYYKNKVEIVLKLIEKDMIESAVDACIILIQSVGAIVLKKIYAVNAFSVYNIANLSSEFCERGEKELSDIFLNINGYINLTIEHGDFNKKDVDKLLNYLNDALESIEKKYVDFFE